MLDGVKQLGENVFSFFDYVSQTIQTAFGFSSVSFFKFAQPIELTLFLFVRISNHVHLWPLVVGLVVTVQANDRTDAFVDLSFKRVPGSLNLTSLISSFHRAYHAALLFDLPEFFQNRFFNGVADRFHSG